MNTCQPCKHLFGMHLCNALFMGIIYGWFLRWSRMSGIVWRPPASPPQAHPTPAARSASCIILHVPPGPPLGVLCRSHSSLPHSQASLELCPKHTFCSSLLPGTIPQATSPLPYKRIFYLLRNHSFLNLITESLTSIYTLVKW